MSQQHINTGSSPNSGTGDPLRTCFIKAEKNFNELYSTVSTPFPYTGNATINGTLSVTGYITASSVTASSIVASTLSSLGNLNNRIELNNDNIKIIANGDTVEELSTNGVTINPNNLTYLDFIIKGGGGDIDLLVANVGTNRVGIGTSSPEQRLHVNGNIKATEYHGNITEGDPAVAGQFFQTSSEGLGGSAPFYQVVCISQG
jgi:hypothetical protein